MDREPRFPQERYKQPLSDHAARKEILENRERLERRFYNAIGQGDHEEMRRLREQGLPPLLSASKPLHAAVWTDNVKTLSLLLEWGEDIDGCDAYGNSPLCEAILGGHLQVLDYLLQQGADPHVFSANKMSGSMPEPGEPLLRQAVFCGEEWLTRQPVRVPGLCAGLACLFDRRPALLSEWEGVLHHILVVAHRAPDREQRWRLLVAEALRQRGREN